MNINKLEEIKEESLTNDDINKLLSGTSILTYPELKYKQTVDEILDENGRAVILFLTENENTGHWVAIHKDEDDNIYYFDPYGLDPEGDKKWIPTQKLQELDEIQPYLSNLLKRSKSKVYSNQYPFQKDKQGISTCGRHCAVRLLYKHLDLDDYLGMIKSSGLSPDDFVSKLTYKIIQK
jgi:hypothetical protein